MKACRLGSVYQTLPTAEARQLEFRYTPKHGNSLNMAEIEFSVLSRCCLGQGLLDVESLCR